MIELYRPELFSIVNNLAKAMHAESAYKDCSWNDAKMEALLRTPGIFCALAKDEDGYYGGIIGMVSEYFFGDDLVANDIGMFILPEKRGGRAVIALVQAFEYWAAAQGAREIQLGQTTGVEIERTRRLYEGLGYEVMGFNAKKELRYV